MRSTGDIQFFVCRSRIIPEPPFPSQGIAGSGNEIADMVEYLVPRSVILVARLDLSKWRLPGLKRVNILKNYSSGFYLVIMKSQNFTRPFEII